MKKLDYQKFKKYVLTHLQEYLPEEYREFEVREDLVPKTNGYREAIVVNVTDSNRIAPILYCADLFDAYQKSSSIEDVMRFASEIFAYGMNYGKAMLKCVDPEPGPEQIIMMMVGTERNRKLLDGIPHREILDLSIYYRYMFPLPDGTFNAATIDYGQMKREGMTEEDLYARALENTPRLLPLKRLDMEENIFVVTNGNGIMGASAILYPGVLAECADQLGSDLYIVPSSVHECILIPVEIISDSYLQHMIREANLEVVDPKDQLSDHLYYYSRAEDEILMVPEAAEEVS